MTYSEVYPPLNFVRAIEKRQPELLVPFRCLSPRRAVVKQNGDATTSKLIQVDEKADELFNLAADPLELEDMLPARPQEAAALNQELNRMASQVERQRDDLTAGGQVEIDDDQVVRRLRGLGYID